MTLRTFPWARAALLRDGTWEAAVRLSAGHKVRLSAKTAGGPFVATCGWLSTLDRTAVVDVDPFRAVERALALGSAPRPADTELRAMAGDR